MWKSVLSRRKFLALAGVFAAGAFVDFTKLQQGTPPLTGRLFQNMEPMPAQSIAGILDSASRLFDPCLQPYLSSVPVFRSTSADTAFEHTATSPALLGDRTYIAVSQDFDRTAAQSKYWKDYYSQPPYNMKPGDPPFSDSFKMALLVHELFHVSGNYLKMDYPGFYSNVADWYTSEQYGRPTPNGISNNIVCSNRTKYILWWYLYPKPGAPDTSTDNAWKAMNYNSRYKTSSPGMEEFAYIGQAILSSDSEQDRSARLQELSPSVFDWYKGVIHPDILTLRTS